MAKFTLDQQEILETLKGEKETTKAIEALIESLVAAQERDVLRLNLTPANEKDLLIKKAKAEGGRSILIELRRYFGLS